jgi:hypothetical protein
MKTNKGNFRLYAPQNSWDMNYHLLDTENNIEYLIDIDNITNDINEEDGGLYIETLLNLEDLDEILDYAWQENPYISDSYMNIISGTKETIDQLLLTL